MKQFKYFDVYEDNNEANITCKKLSILDNQSVNIKYELLIKTKKYALHHIDHNINKIRSIYY